MHGRQAGQAATRRARCFCGDDLCDAHVLVRLARGIRASLYALVHLHFHCASVARSLSPRCAVPKTARTPAPGMRAATTAGRRDAPVQRRAPRPRKRRQSACRPPSCARSRPPLPCFVARTLAAAPQQAPLAPAATPPSSRARRVSTAEHILLLLPPAQGTDTHRRLLLRGRSSRPGTRSAVRRRLSSSFLHCWRGSRGRRSWHDVDSQHGPIARDATAREAREARPRAARSPSPAAAAVSGTASGAASPSPPISTTRLPPFFGWLAAHVQHE